VDIVAAFKYPFTNPRWGMTMLYASLCQIIPVIGPMVLLGYFAEMIERLEKAPQAPCPEFRMDRLESYIRRGLWPFLALLLLGVALVPMIGVSAIPALTIPIFHLDGLAAVMSGMASGLLVLGAVVLVALISTPVGLASMLSGQVSTAFSPAYLTSWLRLSFGSLLLLNLLLMAIAIPMTAIGYMACFVGVYPAIAWLSYAQWHLAWQVYRTHLQRGGEPVLGSRPLVEADWA
jgi:hypothetical protein